MALMPNSWITDFSRETVAIQPQPYIMSMFQVYRHQPGTRDHGCRGPSSVQLETTPGAVASRVPSPMQFRYQISPQYRQQPQQVLEP